MPHYKDGSSAAVGDVVKGKGYNLKDEQGELREIVGVIVVGEATGEHHVGGKYAALVTEYGQADQFERLL